MAIRHAHWKLAFALGLVTAFHAGCGGGGGGGSAVTSGGGPIASTPTPRPGATPTPTATPTPGPLPTPSPVSSAQDVLTFHNDAGRTGQYAAERTLTQANVNAASFGLRALLAVDGKVDAQPLFAGSVTIPGRGTRNLVFVATEHATLYAFDADANTVVWSRSLLGSGETPSDARSCDQVTPEIGITATPAIDRARGTNGTLYAVAMSRDGSGGYHQRIHAVDLATGTETLGGPVDVRATYPGTGSGSNAGTLTFDPAQYEERAGLLLSAGKLWLAWSSHCDIGPYTGWIMAYDAATLAQTGVLNVTPNGSMGAVWMAGDGLQADAAGNVYFLDGNGTFDGTLDGSGFPNQGNFGNGFLKIAASGAQLRAVDYFATYDTIAQSNADNDLGSGGSILLPDLVDGNGATRHLAVGAGKDAKIYVVDRDNMGKYNGTSNTNYQVVDGVLGSGSYSTPAYFNGTLYYGAGGDALKAIPITAARLASTPSSQTTNGFPYPGTTPAVSANGTSNAIVWAVTSAENNRAVLHAYDATNLARELYDSDQAAAGRDHFGNGNKFIAPMVAAGRVYVGTLAGVAVFGLF